MVVHRIVLGHADPIKDTEFICHICMICMKSNADLKCHLRGHETRNEAETIKSDAEDREVALI